MVIFNHCMFTSPYKHKQTKRKSNDKQKRKYDNFDSLNTTAMFIWITETAFPRLFKNQEQISDSSD